VGGVVVERLREVVVPRETEQVHVEGVGGGVERVELGGPSRPGQVPDDEDGVGTALTGVGERSPEQLLGVAVHLDVRVRDDGQPRLVAPRPVETGQRPHR
jgi:hypothetical protein